MSARRDRGESLGHRPHVELKGEATFESMEDWLRVHIEGNGRGQFVAACVARDQPGTGNTFGFELRFDQTEPAVIRSLNAALTVFPVTGRG